MNDERRGFQRHQILAEVIVTDVRSGLSLKGHTGDLSTSGCFIDMLNTLPHGAEIRIKVLRDEDTFTALGVVKSSIPKMGMGIAFTLVESSQADVLRRWLS